MAEAGHRFASWNLSDGLSCAPSENASPCTLGGHGAGAAAATATFVAVFDLAVGAGTGGEVGVSLNGGDAGTVGAGASSAVAVATEDMVTLVAMTEAGQRFASWNLSDGLSCAPSENASPCTLGGHGAGAAAATATFVAVFDLAVGAGDGGSVDVMLNGGDAGTVGAGASSAVAVATEDMVTLTAAQAEGFRFDSWNLLGGLSCAPSENANPCTLSGHGLAAATATAVFVAVSGLTVSAGTGGEVTAVYRFDRATVMVSAQP